MTPTPTTHRRPTRQSAEASSRPRRAAAIDPAVLKTAYNAFKKRWKLTRLDYESRIGKSPLAPAATPPSSASPPPKNSPKPSGKNSPNKAA